MSASIEQRNDYPSVACGDSSPDKGSQGEPQPRTRDSAQALAWAEPDKGSQGEPQPCSCEGCDYDLGGGRDNCMLNVAFECRDGGGFEAWKPRKRTEPEQPKHIAPTKRLDKIFTAAVMQATVALDVTKAAVCQDWRAGIYYMRTLDELSAQIASVTDADYSKQLTEMLDAKKHCYGLDEQAWLMQKALELLAAGASRKNVMEYMDYKAYEAHLRGR